MMVAKFLVCVETINPKHNILLEGCYQQLDCATFPVTEEKEAKERLNLLKSQGKLVRLYQLMEIPCHKQP